MNKILALLLVLCLALSVCALAGAETYETYDENPSTFETFEEAGLLDDDDFGDLA